MVVRTRRCLACATTMWFAAFAPAYAETEQTALKLLEERTRALGGESQAEPSLLEVKFRDNLQIRLVDGVPKDIGGHGLESPDAQYLLKVVLAVAIWTRSHTAPEDALDRLRAEGERLSGKHLPDLNLYFRVRLPPGLDTNLIGAKLSTLPEVEAVYRVPRPAPLPTAPNYYAPNNSRPYQRYQDAAPDGVNSRGLDSISGARGTGIKICDIEFSFNAAHADLGPVMQVGDPGTVPPTVDATEAENHGTAVQGVYGSLANGEGTTGIAYLAQKLFAAAYTSGAFNVAGAVTSCATSMAVGDVIVIEQQTNGPTGAFVPVEWNKASYDAIVGAVAAGRVVVEAAGNGNQDLDGSAYSTNNGGHYPFLPQYDSGAVMVGSGNPPGTDARSASPSSNYGCTLDLQGWGDAVVTTGYGHLYQADGKNRFYTHDFAGTSSAAPIVAGAVASLQAVSKNVKGVVLSPSDIRNRLRTSGTPQTGTKIIGPLPDVGKAISILLETKGSQTLPAPTNLRIQ